MRIPFVRNITRPHLYACHSQVSSRGSSSLKRRHVTMSTNQVNAWLKQQTKTSDLHRLSEVTKLSAHVTRVLGQNPGMMTLQGTNSYLLQPPSNPLAPIILIDTSSPHTAQQYVDLLMSHLYHLGLESGTRETHFESHYAEASLKKIPEDQRAEAKAKVFGVRMELPNGPDDQLTEYGGAYGRWTANAKGERQLPPVEHIILTHRHLDHVGAVPTLLKTLKDNGLPPPKIWKFPSPDEDLLTLSERDRPTTDAALYQALPQGAYHRFSPFQPIHPIMPGLMISILDPQYKHLLKHDKDGKPLWNDVPEIARVSLRCLRTPGHTADSVSLVLVEGEKGVFTGDTVLGQGTTVFTDLAAYMTSLKTLLALKPATLYPAHGPHLTGKEECAAYIEDYITHRQEREDQIVSLLQKVAADPASLGQIVVELLQHLEKEKKAQDKYDHEFLSGKPYTAPNPKDEKVDAKATPKEDDSAETAKNDADGSEKTTDAATPQAMSDEDKEAAKWEAIRSKFSANENPVTTSLICRILYRTAKEALIYAATRSIDAHLVKLEGEGKVKKKMAMIPKIIEGEVGEQFEQECWEWVGKP